MCPLLLLWKCVRINCHLMMILFRKCLRVILRPRKGHRHVIWSSCYIFLIDNYYQSVVAAGCSTLLLFVCVLLCCAFHPHVMNAWLVMHQFLSVVEDALSLALTNLFVEGKIREVLASKYTRLKATHYAEWPISEYYKYIQYVISLDLKIDAIMCLYM